MKQLLSTLLRKCAQLKGKALRLYASPYITILRYKVLHPKASLWMYVPTYGKKGYYTATSVHLLKMKSNGQYIIAIHTDCK